MTGEIIRFQSLRDFKRAQLYRKQSVPRGVTPGKSLQGAASPSFSCAERTGSTNEQSQRIERHIARIARLLEELEELADMSRNVSPSVLRQARVHLRKARKFLEPWPSEPCVSDCDEADGDPQPVIDNEMLEQMYRELNPDR